MGEVHRATDTRLHRTVAIKVLPRETQSNPENHRRFLQEAQAASALNHPNIVTLYDISHDKDIDYLVMEFVRGKALHDFTPAQGLTIRELCRYGMQIAGALAAAHAAGIVHRDLKPGNIMISTDGQAKVLDFGLAKLATSRDEQETLTAQLTMPGVVLGTPSYMSPEQSRGEFVDARSDIFSLGCVLYQAATGRVPFNGGNALAIVHEILTKDPDPPSGIRPDVPPWLDAVILKCLRKDPLERYQSMLDVQAALREPPPPIAISVPSLAVLPFANLSADKDNEYFGDGLAEELLNSLAQIPNLKVIARTSAFAFKGKQEDIRKIADTLGVTNILEGSVRKAGNRIRVTAQLIKAADGFHIWSERYDREMTDVFAIQDEITEAIAAALRVRLSAGATSSGHTPDLRAYQEYLKAKELWLKATTLELMDSFKRSVERAIQLDPEFALPYTLLGLYHASSATRCLKPAREELLLAYAAGLQALRVDPALPEAHALLGVCACLSLNWSEAEHHWRNAMKREPVSADVRLWHGNHYLVPLGRYAEALQAMTRSLQDDPLNLLYRNLFAHGLRIAGRIEDAEEECRKILDINDSFVPSLGLLGGLRAQQGHLQEALVLTEKAYTLSPKATPSLYGQLAALLTRTGNSERANMLMETVVTENRFGYPLAQAVFHALCGQFEEATKWAEQAIHLQNGLIVHDLGPLMQHAPQWPALKKLMNL